MLIPLTDPEHPLAKQMLQLIGAHSHLPKATGAEATATATADAAADVRPQQSGGSLVDRVLPPRRRTATAI
jgi:hypothetical protein